MLEVTNMSFLLPLSNVFFHGRPVPEEQYIIMFTADDLTEVAQEDLKGASLNNEKKKKKRSSNCSRLVKDQDCLLVNLV